MDNEITQEEFRKILKEGIDKERDTLLYAFDVIVPSLEAGIYDEPYIQIIGSYGLLESLNIFINNVSLLRNDMLMNGSDFVYFINERNLPARMDKTDYERMIKGETTEKDEKNNMFG